MIGKRGPIELDRLSQRERSIVDLAIEGHTDAQIAQELQITPNTVNSYWVRVRGKLGHISRTELVSTILRQQSARQLGEVQGDLNALQLRVTELAEMDEMETEQTSSILRIALSSLPEPIFTVNEFRIVQFVNDSMSKMLSIEAGATVASLVISEDVVRLEDALSDAMSGKFELDHPPVHHFRTLRPGGNLVQIAIQFYGYRREEGKWVTGVIRSYEDAIRLL